MSPDSTDHFSPPGEVGPKEKARCEATVDSFAAPSPAEVGCSLLSSIHAAPRPTGSQKLSVGSVPRRNRQTASAAGLSSLVSENGSMLSRYLRQGIVGLVVALFIARPPSLPKAAFGDNQLPGLSAKSALPYAAIGGCP